MESPTKNINSSFLNASHIATKKNDLDTIDEQSDFGVSQEEEHKKLISFKQFLKSPSHGRLFSPEKILYELSPALLNSEDVIESERKLNENQMYLEYNLSRLNQLNNHHDESDIS